MSVYGSTSLSRFGHAVHALAWVLLSLGLGSTAFGQGPNQSQSQARALAKLEAAGGMGGLRIYDKGSWGLVRSQVTNPSASTRTPLLLINYEGVPEPQYGNRLWMPPHSRRVVLTPVTPFGVKPAGASGVEIRVRLIDDSGSGERARPASPGTLVRPAEGNPLRSASFLPADDPAPGDLVTALRLGNHLGRTNLSVNARSAPALPAAWQSLDVLMFANQPDPLGPAQIQAIRQWVYSGGRLWIMLDQTGPALAQSVLGQDWDLAVIDRIGLTDFTIRSKKKSNTKPNANAEGDKTDPTSQVSQPVTHDYPFDLVRVNPGRFDVIHTVAGYPASLRKSVGQGQVVVTTLEAGAWLVDQPSNSGANPTSSDQDKGGPQRRASDRHPGAALKQLAWMYAKGGRPGPRKEFAAARSTTNDTGSANHRGEDGQTDSATSSLAALGPYMTEQVGVNVLGRTVVLVILGLFTLGLLVGGVILLWRGRLEWIGVLSAALAVVAVVVLVGMGYTHGRKSPAVLATSAVVDAPPQSPVAALTAMASVYRPAGAKGNARLSVDGLMPVITQDLKSIGPLRLIFTDYQQWTFDNLDLAPQAVHTLRLTGTQPLTNPLQGTLTFTDSGLGGRIDTGAWGPLEDPLLIAASDRLAPKIDKAGNLTAIAEQARLGEDQTIQAGVLSQQQMERSRVYQSLLADQSSSASGPAGRLNHPLFYGWASRLAGVSIKLSKTARKRASSLLRIPLKIEPPPAGQSFTVPAPFLIRGVFRGSTDSGMNLSTTAYDPRTQTWLTLAQSQTIMMRYTLPRAVQSMALTRCVVHIDLKAPGRPYEVVTLANGKIKTLSRGDNVDGRFEVELTDNHVPAKRHGQILIGLRIGPANGANQATGQGSRYLIRDLQVTATGTMSP